MQKIAPSECAGMIRKARSIVALTGAGISTAAGIPDFRGPRGLYVTRRYDPEKVFKIGGFLHEPRYFYEFSRDFVATVRDVRPTFSHRFLAALEFSGKLTGIVTQNIDMLHRQAGSRRVVELHGSYGSATCLDCGDRLRDLDYVWWQRAMRENPDSPVVRCRACNGVLKPDIVFFGEMVNGYERAERMVRECDLLLVLGSSLQVVPASLLPYGCDAPTVVVNRGEVDLPPAAHRFFADADLDGYFARVADGLADRA